MKYPAVPMYMKLHKAQWELICKQGKAISQRQKDYLAKRIFNLAREMNAISGVMTSDERREMRDEVAIYHTGKPFHAKMT